MLDTIEFGQVLKRKGYDFYSGVPCSFLNNLINYAMNHEEYVMAANEGDAVAICVGAYLGGRKTVFLCQNSGLTNAVSPLTSLNYVFRIPTLGFVSLRGEAGLGDEPQHELMGQITTEMLNTMRIRWDYLSANFETAAEQVKLADEVVSSGQSYFFVVRKNTFLKEELQCGPIAKRINQNKVIKTGKDACPRRWEALLAINEHISSQSVCLATTGYTGRELYELEDLERNLYLVGSMGCFLKSRKAFANISL